MPMSSSRSIVILVLFVSLVHAEIIPLSSALPKLQAIHEDSKSLLIKNVELKSKILAGLQQQNEATIKQVQETKLIDATPTTQSSNETTTFSPQSLATQPTNFKPTLAGLLNKQQQQRRNETKAIDYVELEEFNKWVETNLEYAVKNTQASAEALKEEAQQNNGNVDYSEQAIKDGIEGIKYWQSAVIFQDKTLKNETYEPPE